MKPHVKTATLLFAGAFFFCPFFALKPTPKPVNAIVENPYGWDKISSYTTYYSQKDVGRCANIAIAASLIDGVTIQPYGEFSFNSTVGRRTEEAGFQQAKIIVKGEYVLGVGGGLIKQRSLPVDTIASREGWTYATRRVCGWNSVTVNPALSAALYKVVLT